MVGQERYQEINLLLNQRLERQRVLIAVHRGSWGGNIVENTIPAYMASIQMGADLFEADLVSSIDGVLYTFHDTYEGRLLRKRKNIKTMASRDIDRLRYYNCIGEATDQPVTRFEEVLSHFDKGELFNLDRAWSILPQVDAVLRHYPEAHRQVIIKTPAKAEYLEFFQSCPVKYPYMPICRSMADVRLAMSYLEVNLVGVEAIAPTPEAELFALDNIRWLRERGLFVWCNAISLSKWSRHILSAGYSDDKAIVQGPEAAWGVLMDRGYNILQTDWPAQLNAYRARRLAEANGG